MIRNEEECQGDASRLGLKEAGQSWTICGGWGSC
jgi:hypothetical protein